MHFSFVLLPFAFLLLTEAAILPQAQQQQQRASSSSPAARTPADFIYSGRMIRYETQPMQYVNNKGEVVSAKQAGAKTDSCVDFEGQTQPNGAEYQRRNKHFFYKCNNGDEEVVACVGTERTGSARIAVGENLSVKGFDHRCQRMANGSIVYSQSPSCQYSGQEYPVNAEFMMGPLKALCQETGFKIIGCVYDIGGQKVNMAPGESRDFQNQRYLCTVANSNGQQSNQQQQQSQTSSSTANGGSESAAQPQRQQQNQQTSSSSQQFQQQKKISGCNRNGQRMAEGELHQANHIRYRCAPNGFLEIIGCYNGAGTQMTIGQDIVEKNTVYRCFQAEGKSNTANRLIEYTEYACGYLGGPSCTPTPISTGSGGSQSQQQQSKSAEGTTSAINNNTNNNNDDSKQTKVAAASDKKEGEQEEEKTPAFPAKKTKENMQE